MKRLRVEVFMFTLNNVNRVFYQNKDFYYLQTKTVSF